MGKLLRKKIDYKKYLNKKFGHLTILQMFKKKEDKRSHTYCRCKCTCGKISIKRFDVITSGVSSCCRYETLDNVKRQSWKHI